MVRNNKNTKINIEVLDQIPLSKNKDIAVELVEYEGAEYNPDYGKLQWNIELAPGQTKKLKFVVSVKYPKDKKINGF
jgi:hypothetical protein